MVMIAVENKQTILRELDEIISGLTSDDWVAQGQAACKAIGIENRIFDWDILSKYRELQVIIKQMTKERKNERKRNKQSSKN
jgi:hypothetical protein